MSNNNENIDDKIYILNKKKCKEIIDGMLEFYSDTLDALIKAYNELNSSKGNDQVSKILTEEYNEYFRTYISYIYNLLINKYVLEKNKRVMCVYSVLDSTIYVAYIDDNIKKKMHESLERAKNLYI